MNCHEKSSCINIYCCHGNGENCGNNGNNGGGTVIPGSLQTDWYVSNAGDNISGDGTQGNPFMTIQHAIDMVAMSLISTKQHTIHVADGFYAESLDIQGLNLLVTGNMDNPANAKIGGTDRDATVASDANSHVIFKGILFESPLRTGTDYKNTYLVNGTSTCIFDTCIFNNDNPRAFDLLAHGNSFCDIQNISFTGNARRGVIGSYTGSVVRINDECYIHNSMAIDLALVAAGSMGSIQINTPITLVSGTVMGAKYYVGELSRIYGESKLPVTSSPGVSAPSGQIVV